MPLHPEKQRLVDYSSGKLPAEEVGDVSKHLEECAQCEATISALEASSDTLASGLLDMPDVEPFVDEQAFRRGIAEVDRLPETPPKDEAGTATSMHDSQTGSKPTAKSPSSKPFEKLGPYELLDKLGEGGMGAVYKARHAHLGKIMAVKILPQHAVKDAAAVARFRREMLAVGSLQHPNIVTAFDAGEADGVHYLAMEYVAGCDLSSLIKRDGPLPVETAVSYMLQAAHGLEAAHAAGIVHRDMKPANLLVDDEGTVKILDMGLARLDDGSAADKEAQHGLTQTGQVMGTVDYMAPEQAFDTHRADAKADVYSLGCTLYRIVTGENAFRGDTVVQKILAHREQPIPSLAKLRPEAPAALDAICKRMLAKTPEERPTMAELVRELEALQRSEVGGQKSDEIPSIVIDVAKPRIAASPATRVSVLSGSASDGRKLPPKKPIAAALGGFALILAGVLFIIRDKDGNEIARVNAPDGSSVTASVAPSPTVPKPAGDRDRVVAEWFLRKRVNQPTLPGLGIKTASGGGGQIWNLADLPKEPFVITGLDLVNLDYKPPFDISDDELQNIAGLHELEALNLDCNTLTDRACDVLATLPALGNFGVARAKFSADGWAKLKGLERLWRVTFVESDLRGRLRGLREYRGAGTLRFYKGSRVEPADIEALAERPYAPMLEFYADVLTDEHVPAFAAFARNGQAPTLILNDTKVSAAGVAQLVAALPKSKIISPHIVDGAYVQLLQRIDPARDVIPLHGANATNPWSLEPIYKAMDFTYADQLSGKLRLPLDVAGREYQFIIHFLPGGANPQLDIDIPLAAGVKRIRFDKPYGWHDLRVRKLGDNIDISVGDGVTYETRWRGDPNSPDGLIPYAQTQTDPKTLALLADGGNLGILQLNLKFLDKPATPSVPISPAIAERNRAAADWVLNKGGSVVVKSASGASVQVHNYNRANLPKDPFVITGLGLHSDPFSVPFDVRDEELESLADLTAMEWVTLDCGRLTDRSLDVLAKWRELQALGLIRAKFSADGLGKLKALPKFYRLGFSETEIAGQLKRVAELPLLWHLDFFSGCRLTTSDVEALAAPKHPQPLLRIDFYSDSVNDDQVPALAKLNQLPHLLFRNSGVSAAGVERLVTALPRCEIVSQHAVAGATMQLIPHIDVARDAVQVLGLTGANVWEHADPLFYYQFSDSKAGKLRLPVDVAGRDYELIVQYDPQGGDPQLEVEVPLAAGAKSIRFPTPGERRVRVNRSGTEVEITDNANEAVPATWRGNSTKSDGLKSYADTRTDTRTIGLVAHGGRMLFYRIDIKFLDKPATSPPAAPFDAKADPDRAVAEWALPLGAKLYVVPRANPGAKFTQVTTIADLPAEPFWITGFWVNPSWCDPRKFDDAAIDRLADLKQLSGVEFYGAALTNAGAAKLASYTSLETVIVREMHSVDDAGVLPLLSLPRLNRLSVNGTKITDRTLAAVADCPHLVTLGMAYCTEITDAGLDSLLSKSNLESLEIGYPYPAAVRMTDEGLLKLAALKNLKLLDIQGLAKRSTFEALRTALPSCSIRWRLSELKKRVGGTAQGSLRAIEHKSGKELVVTPRNLHPGVADSDIEHIVEINLQGDVNLKGPLIGWLLSELTAVETLNLDDTGVTDKELPAIEALTGLKQLSLRGTKVTAAGVARLQQALPDCKIENGPATPAPEPAKS